jgi:hypothetical protein
MEVKILFNLGRHCRMVSGVARTGSSVCRRSASYWSAFSALCCGCDRVLQHYAHLFRSSGGSLTSVASRQHHHADDFHFQCIQYHHSCHSCAKQVNETAIHSHFVFKFVASLFNWLLSGSSLLILVLLLLFYQNQDRRSLLDS